MSDSCCTPSDLLVTRRRRVLLAVLAINAIMFVAELATGLLAGSVALQADSLDMLGDALVYGASIAVVAGSMHARARVAQLKGAIMLLFAIGVLGQVARKILGGGPPDPIVVTGMGFTAMTANLVCLGLLFRHRDDDLNMRSTWICSRNDIAANAGVLLSAAGVAMLHSIWPDVLISVAITVLFLLSATTVLRSAHAQLRQARDRIEEFCRFGLCPKTACTCQTA